MPALKSLTQWYGGLFYSSASFAVCPYTETFLAVARPEHNSNEGEGQRDNIAGRVIAGAVVCGILTFVVPVLPLLTSFTVTLASIALSLAVMSMFITYPVALLMDICPADNRSHYQPGYAF